MIDRDVQRSSRYDITHRAQPFDDQLLPGVADEENELRRALDIDRLVLQQSKRRVGVAGG